jgi:hypothetical protein
METRPLGVFLVVMARSKEIEADVMAHLPPWSGFRAQDRSLPLPLIRLTRGIPVVPLRG